MVQSYVAGRNIRASYLDVTAGGGADDEKENGESDDAAVAVSIDFAGIDLPCLSLCNHLC